MKHFNGYDEAKKSAQYKGSVQIPTGAYVAKVMAVKFEEGKDGNSDVIAVQFDISEGEQKDFFRKQYEANTNEDKKWKGAVRIYCPKDDGSERDGWTKNAFARWVDSFEKSNPGYAWDWDEKKWKNKFIGLIFGETGTNINGKDIVYTEVHRPCSIDEVRNDTFYKKALDLVKKKGYKGGSSSGAASDFKKDAGFVDIPQDATEEDIPF